MQADLSEKTLQISVLGPVKNRKIIKALIIWSSELLLDRRICNELSIRIVFKRKLIKNENALGQIKPGKKPRAFTIEVAYGCTLSQTLSTLIHEMVHVKQYATGELSDSKTHDYLTSWKGKAYIVPEHKNGHYWEAEALSLEKKLFKKFIKDFSKSEYSNTVNKLVFK